MTATREQLIERCEKLMPVFKHSESCATAIYQWWQFLRQDLLNDAGLLQVEKLVTHLEAGQYL